MAENKRVRIEPHIEEYLVSQAERVLGKTDKLTAAELSTLANTICYEHKLGRSIVKQLPLPRLFDWIVSLVPRVGGIGQLSQTDSPALKSSPVVAVDDFDIDADLGDLYEEAA